jgi:hypothetical protein
MDTYNKDAILPSSLGRGPPAIIVIFHPVCFAMLSIMVAKVNGSLSMALLTYVRILLARKEEHAHLILTVNLVRGHFRHLGSMFFDLGLHIIARGFVLCSQESILECKPQGPLLSILFPFRVLGFPLLQVSCKFSVNCRLQIVILQISERLPGLPVPWLGQIQDGSTPADALLFRVAS